MTRRPYPYFNPAVTPGQESARIQAAPELEQGRRYESQHARKVVPGPGLAGIAWSDLPKILVKGCPHCKGSLDKEHPDYGYGDYACVNCGRAWDVESVSRGTGGRLHVKLGRVGHYLKQKPPKSQVKAKMIRPCLRENPAPAWNVTATRRC